MKIGGFIRQSLIDYPGKIASVIFTQGCNFRCGYCHNPQLVLPELFESSLSYDPESILRYIKDHKDWLDGVVVTGGEPTIHNDLPEFLKEIKEQGFLIKLDTNGSNPFMLDNIVRKRLVDYIAMDIKMIPERDLYAEIIGIDNAHDMVENVLASVILLKNSPVDIEFRTTCIPGVHNDIMIDLIRNFIGSDKRYIINEFREGKTVNFYKRQLTDMG